MMRPARLDAARSGRFRRAAAIAALSLLAYSGWARAGDSPWRERLAQAERLSEEGKTDEAAAGAQGVLADADKSLGPETAEIGRVLVRLSRVYAKAGDAARYPEMEKRLAEFKSKDFMIWAALGELLRDDGRPSEAEDALKHALLASPDDAEAELQLTQVYDDMGRYDDEARLLSHRIERSPRDLALYHRLARVYLSLGRPDRAKETFARARLLDGQTSDAFIEEGYFDWESGERKQAESAFESAIDADTASAAGYHHMGAYLLKRERKPGEAEIYFRRSLEILARNPHAPADDRLHSMIGLALALQNQGRNAEAEALLLRVRAEARPGSERNLRALLLLARFYEAHGRNERAEKAFSDIAEACGARFKCNLGLTVEALIDFGRFYLALGRRAEAEAVAERAEKLSRKYPIADALDALDELSRFYKELGDESNNEALYRRLLPLRRTMPFNAGLVWVEAGLAESAAAHGRLKEAEDLYRQAIAVTDRNRCWEDEAGLLDALAAVEAREEGPEGRREAEADGRRAAALRSRP